MKFSAICGVCNERLEWEQVGDTSWGIIGVLDQGCVSVTIQDPTGEVSAHMRKHAEDGSFIEAHKKAITAEGIRFENMKERGLI
jgi:hypothetical protein